MGNILEFSKNPDRTITGKAELNNEQFTVIKFLPAGDYSRSFIISSNGTEYLLKLLISKDKKNDSTYTSEYKTKATSRNEYNNLTTNPKTGKHRNFAKMRKKGIYIPEPYSLYEDIKVTDTDANFTETYCSGIRYEFIDTINFDEFRNAKSTALIFEACHTLCKAVDCINKSGFYHMDLDERNFIFDKHGHAWLVDFTGGFVVNQGILISDGYYKVCNDLAFDFYEKSKIKTGRDCEEVQARSMVEFLKRALEDTGIFNDIVLSKIYYSEKSPMKELRKELLKKCSFTYRLRSFK